MVVEAFAFYLSMHAKLVDDETLERERETLKRNAQADWCDIDVRRSYRKKAKIAIDVLENMGVRLKGVSTSQLEETIEFLRTIPAKVAYDASELEG